MPLLAALAVQGSHLQAALVCLVACAALGRLAPPLIARLPEPVPEPVPGPVPEPVPEPVPGPVSQPEPVPEPASSDGSRADVATQDRRLFARTLPPAPPKELYTDIAALPHLAGWVALWSGVVGAMFGLALGWTGALVYLVPLVPIGVVLTVIDWRTTLLPTRVLHPTYLLIALLVPLAALLDRDLDSLYRAGWGWLVLGGWFWIFWWLFRAWGFGDVRLSRVLGPALGYLGWTHLTTGLALMLLVGAIGGLVVAAVRGSLRARVPYGPFMLVGAAVAVVAGPSLARGLGY
jgi:leader peptidase (prepilin peptidase)/N-methyltransferase